MVTAPFQEGRVVLFSSSVSVGCGAAAGPRGALETTRSKRGKRKIRMKMKMEVGMGPMVMTMVMLMRIGYRHYY